MPLLTLLLPAVLPAVMDGIRSLIGRFTGGAGARPQNVDEAIKLKQADIDMLKALAEIDRPTGDISRWVADLRASFRYLAAAMIILGTLGLAALDAAGSVIVNPEILSGMLDMMGSVWAFMFGDRMYFGLKKGR